MPMQAYRIKRVDLNRNGADSLSVIRVLQLHEEVFYSESIPYSVVLQRYSKPDNIYLHHGNTLEVMLLNHLKGSIFVAGRKYVLEGIPKVIVIPPEQLHAGEIKPIDENGEILNFKISIKDIRPIMDFEKMMEQNGLNLNDMAFCTPDYQQFHQAVMDLALADNDYFERMICLLKIYRLLGESVSQNRPVIQATDIHLKNMNDLVEWTEQHFSEHISLEQAAEVMHLSKYYFCKYFRNQTGATYLVYLNQVRIRHAAEMLSVGNSAEECCRACGFESVPYFIQLFRKYTGYSTREYREYFRNLVK